MTLIWLNKYLFKFYGWQFSSTLTSLHLLTTCLFAKCTFCFSPSDLCLFVTRLTSVVCLHLVTVSIYSGKSEAQTGPSLPFVVKSLYALVMVGSIVFMNLSLMWNSVGYYQMVKLLVTPAIVSIEYFGFGKRYSYFILGSLVLVTVGVGFAVVDGIEATTLGIFVSALAVCATAANQIYAQQLQCSKSHPRTGMQLLDETSLYAVGFLIVSAPFFDNLSLDPNDPSTLWNYPYDIGVILLILASCAGAFCVNLATVLVIGKFSPITYQLIGHTKTLLILVIGFLLFHEHLTLEILTGIAIAFVGLGLYSYFKIHGM